MKLSLGDAILFVGADNTPLKKALAQSEKSVVHSTAKMSNRFEGVGASVKGVANMLVGGYVANSLKNYAMQWIQLGDTLDETAQRTGISVEKLSALKYVAERAGSSLSGIEVAIRSMSRNLYSASTGTKLFGDSLSELKRLNTEQQFEAMLRGLAQIPDQTQRSAVAMQVFGKSGAEVLPLIADGIDGYGKSVAEAKAKGQVFTKEQAEDAAKYADAIDDLSRKWTAFMGAVISSSPGDLMRRDMEGLTAFIDSPSWQERLSALDLIFQDYTGLTNKADAKKEAEGEADNQRAKAANEAAKKGENNWASDERSRKLAMQAMVHGGGPGVSPVEPAPTQQAYAPPSLPMPGPVGTSGYGKNSHTEARYQKESGREATMEGRGMAGNVYNTYNYNTTVSHGSFTAGDDMKRAYNRSIAMSGQI